MYSDISSHRNLSALETAFILPQPNMGLTAIEILGKIDEKIFEKSVECLMERQPYFQKNISMTKESFHWKEVNQSMPFFVIESDDWESVAHAQLSNHFVLGSESYLWRIILVKIKNNPYSNVVLAMGEHVMLDGASIGIMINSLLNYYVVLSRGVQLNITPLPMTQSVLDYQRQDPKCKIDQRKVIHLLEEVEKHNHSWKPNVTLNYDDNTKSVQKNDEFLCAEGTPENLKRLLHRCKQERSSIGLATLTATAWAMAKLERLHAPQKNDSKFFLDINMDVNERRRVNPKLGNEHIQLFISMIPLRIEVQEKDCFWEVTRKIRSQMKSIVSITPNYQAVLENLLKNKKPYWKADANSSLMGKYPFSPQYGDLYIKKIHGIGTKWIPFFGRFVFLSRAVSSMTYDLVYDAQDHENAMKTMSIWKNLVEVSGSLENFYTFSDFLFKKG